MENINNMDTITAFNGLKKRKRSDSEDEYVYVNPYTVERLDIYTLGNDIYFTSPVTNESIQKVIKEMHKILHANSSKSKLTISYTIDSPGGSVFSILKFVDFINLARKKYKNVKFVSIITGYAASAATIMALTADERLMTSNAYAMIHELSSGSSGKYTFIKAHNYMVDKLHNNLTQLYVDASGRPREQIEELMKNETWFSAQEYKDLGFVHNIV